MKTLVLLRHAKSSWADPDQEDHDRPLNARGRLAAPLIGAWIAGRGISLDHVICSDSARTVETWERARPELNGAPDPALTRDLYHADPAQMLKLLKGAPKKADAVMMIGHQPGISAFARKLADKTPPPHCARAYEKFPTAAAAVLEFDIKDWVDAAYGGASFTAFAVPRELV